MRPLQKAIRISLAALLLCTLSLFGGLHVGGLAGWRSSETAQIRQDKGGDTRLLHTDLLLLDAAAPNASVLHKGERGGSLGYSPHYAGIITAAMLLHVATDAAVKLQELARDASFTPVQRLALYPHHGFW